MLADIFDAMPFFDETWHGFVNFRFFLMSESTWAKKSRNWLSVRLELMKTQWSPFFNPSVRNWRQYIVLPAPAGPIRINMPRGIFS